MATDFRRFFKPIVQVLKQTGGSGTTAEVIDRVIEMLHISDAEQQIEKSSGGSKVRNQVQWARLYLVHSGILDKSQRGVWALTEKGQQINTDHFDFGALAKTVVREHQEGKGHVHRERLLIDGDADTGNDGETDHRGQLLNVVRNLPPAGFERLCQRLLREAGFQQVEVTGRSGDGGIDGVGVLQINAFVSFRVLFQCKRYQGSVAPSHVRDFRGAMMGRADKGIIVTTGTFTVDARKEARRDGVPPIELVDGEALVSLFESLELGLKPRKTYDIDEAFFEEFKK